MADNRSLRSEATWPTPINNTQAPRRTANNHLLQEHCNGNAVAADKRASWSGQK